MRPGLVLFFSFYFFSTAAQDATLPELGFDAVIVVDGVRAPEYLTK